MADDTVNVDWIRTLSTERLQEWRTDLVIQLAEARRRPKRTGIVGFCTVRIAAIDQELGQRGATAE